MSRAVPAFRPMRHTDLAAVGRVLGRAFADDPLYAVLFPDPVERARILPPYFERSAAAALELGTAWVAEAHGLRVAGAALWAPPATTGAGSTPPGRRHDLAGLFGADALATYGVVMDRLRTRRTASVASPHWYLNLVGVHPSAHGRGIGRSLLKPTLERADREGRITALETFVEANLTLYACFGFRVAHDEREPRTELRWWLLTRPPRRESSCGGSS